MKVFWNSLHETGLSYVILGLAFLGFIEFILTILELY